MIKNKNVIYGCLLLLPALSLLYIFTYHPIIKTIYQSFHSTPKGKRPSVFIGTAHYESMLNDPIFWQSFYNNIIYALFTIPLSMILALLMALFIFKNLKGKSFMRFAFFTPTILPMVAVANIWLFFYAPDYGLVDKFLNLFHIGGSNILGNSDSALGAIIVITTWKEASFFMLFYLAALQQISPSVLEAAKLEGASFLQTLRRIILPLLRPTSLFILINAIIGSFRLIDHIIIMTKGGPDNATSLLLYYIYQNAFIFWDTGFASAITVFLLIILAVIALFQFSYADKRVHYR